MKRYDNRARGRTDQPYRPASERPGRNFGDRARPYGEDYGGDRDWWERTGDEVLSWFGDDYAERRRRRDASHRGKGPRNYKRPDERIREDINDRLTDEWDIDASDIEVIVDHGEVILTGYVNERFQKRRAEDLAEAVSGVTNVENRIKVNSSMTP